MAGKGGKTPGAGRKPKAIKELQKNFASEILSNTIEKNRWLEMLNSDDPRIVLDALKWLGDHKHGKPKQAVEQSGPEGGPMQVILKHVIGPNAAS